VAGPAVDLIDVYVLLARGEEAVEVVEAVDDRVPLAAEEPLPALVA
jgi:hypothetical protein